MLIERFDCVSCLRRGRKEHGRDTFRLAVLLVDLYRHVDDFSTPRKLLDDVAFVDPVAHAADEDAARLRLGDSITNVDRHTRR